MRLLVIVIYVLFSSCLHRGDIIEKEQGIVVKKQYEEGYYYTYTTTTTIPDGNGGFIHIPMVQEDYMPPKYIVSFKCQHQRIFDIIRQDLYQNLKELDTVTIEYYNLLNSNDEVRDYDFITAYKQKQNAKL